MSALLQQFISEARDLIESAGAALLEIEREPNDPEPIDQLFRVMHTLKGSSGLLDVPALTHLVHAGEDLLVLVREQKQPLETEDLDLLLECCDIIVEWIEALEETGELPGDAASVSQEKSKALRNRIRSGDKVVEESAASAPAPSMARAGLFDDEEDNADDILFGLPDGALSAAEAASGGAPLQAVRYAPDEQCYFRGEDPVALWRQVPNMHFSQLTAPGPQPSDDAFDPHQCRLVLTGLTSADKDALTELFCYVLDEVTIAPVSAATESARASASAPGSSGGAASPAAGSQTPQRPLATLPANSAPERLELLHDLLQGQLSVLDGCAGEAKTHGRVESVERLLSNLARTERPLIGREAEIKSVFDGWRDSGELEPVAQLAQKFVAAAAAAMRGEDGPAAGSAPAEMDTPNDKASTPAPGGADNGAAKAPKNGAKSRLLKVDEAKIDVLVNLISEFSVAKNALPFLAKRAEEEFGVRELSRELKDQFTIVDRLAQEMQSAIMSVRLLPVSVIFDRFPRLVRDVSRKLNKKIDLQILREDTEADKSIIEALGDPLIHLVRNSLDHGIEEPAERTAAGKRETATLTIEAQHESDQLIILVKDDGRGVHPEKVKAKALERGVITAEEAVEMTDEQAVNLIFKPGFSTKEAVSELSGRGVGMDAVRSQIQSAGGRVSVSSQVGVGTTVRLSLPLSMAVTRIMTLEVCGSKFGVPMDQVLETVRVKAEDIVAIKGAEAFLLRDRLVPLRRLADLLQLDTSDEDEEDYLQILVARTENGPVGLVVDCFRERMDTILKPLGGLLAQADCYAGAALMGDGSVLLVLNTRSLL
ncbi:MAG: chemotaxis protein CheA [Neomegalonema sp.]|nr:chemotaxis protein CheA [Neomegalonema sp.]